MNESYQNFNYHTHTKRCSHAGNYEDAEYVYYARLNGISTVGFTDHVPFNPIKLPDIKSRMVYSEVDEYISSINALKKDNPDMCILSGFEAEYYPEIEEFLGELRSKVDYMIMGEHFLKGVEVNNKDYPLIYADMVVKGIESGIFDIIAHPDIFIRKRNSISSEEDIVLTSEELNKMSDAQVKKIIPKLKVVARSLPEDKKASCYFKSRIRTCYWNDWRWGE